MPALETTRARFAWWLGLLAIFTTLVLLFGGQVRLDYMQAGSTLPWHQALLISGVTWYLWASVTPLVVWFGRRWPITPHSWWRVAPHLVVCLTLLAAKQTLANGIIRQAVGSPRYPAPLLTLYVHIFTYFTILGVDAWVRQVRARREQELRRSQLEAELASAELEALRVRLQPHFLFNTLNSISALMREDVEAADVMLTRLASLLRATLDRAHVQESKLDDELAFVSEYLEIQRVRFADRLTVRMDVADDTRSLAVPTLVLQPLVENACRHGVEATRGAATLAIRAACRDGRLTIEVQDDGPGPPPVVVVGHGLEATRARLRHLYGESASVTLDRAAPAGAVARLRLPARLPSTAPIDAAV